MDRRTFLAAGASLVAAPALAQKKDRIKIVSSLPRTGSAKGQTDTIANGIKLAIDDYEGKVAGFAIEYKDMDDATALAGQWVADKEADNARESARDKDVMAYIGPYNSGAAKVSMPILNEAGLVMISPACTWPGLTKKVKGDERGGEPDIYRPTKIVNFCRVCMTDEKQGPLVAQYVARELKAKSVYVLHDKELYGSMTAAGFAARCKDFEVKVLGHDGIDVTQQNFKELVGKIKEAKPDALYFGGTSYSGGPQLAKDLKEAGVTFPLVTPDGCYDDKFIKDAGADVFKTLPCYVTLGLIEPSLFFDPSLHPGARVEFAKRYKKKFDKDPEAYAVNGYEAAKVVLEAVKKVGKKDREEIRKAVVGTKDFDKGLLGKWSFDADGDTTFKQMTISKVVDGKFQPRKMLSGEGD